MTNTVYLPVYDFRGVFLWEQPKILDVINKMSEAHPPFHTDLPFSKRIIVESLLLEKTLKIIEYNHPLTLPTLLTLTL